MSSEDTALNKKRLNSYFCQGQKITIKGITHNKTARCLTCHMTFDTHEEFSVHACHQIKVEIDEIEPDKQFDLVGQDGLNNKVDPLDISESDSDYSPKKKKSRKNKIQKKQGKNQKNVDEMTVKDKIEKRKRIRKENLEAEFKIEPTDFANLDQFDIDDDSNIELSEEFISLILQQVNDLCENIKNGDPNIQRTIGVNKNLNDAVSCYRSRLKPTKQSKPKSKHPDDIDYDEIFSESDGVHGPISKKPKGKRKVGRRTNAEDDKKFEFVRNQCGSHTVYTMSAMLNMHRENIKLRMKNEGISLTAKSNHGCPNTKCLNCYFCNLKKETENIDNSFLFPFLNLDSEGSKKDTPFECTICNYKAKIRATLFTHIKSVHQNEIKERASSGTKLEGQYDCGSGTCKKIYYKMEEKKYWCQKCFRISQIPKPEKPKIAKPVTKQKLCPECGASVTSLKIHMNRHHSEKQTCPHCGKVLNSLIAMKIHIKAVHEKVPCAQCGKLVGQNKINSHIESAHTPNDQKKYKCDVCSKGFSSKQNLKDHKHIHTGEKPYKCKFCLSCFASKGNQAMHEKGHLGYKRGQSSKSRG